MVNVLGRDKVITIGPLPMLGGFNSLEVILRESGRFLIRGGGGEFVAISEKKSRSIPVSATIPADSPFGYFYEYENAPVAVEFSSAELFVQDLIADYPVKELNIYGILCLADFTLTAKPSDSPACSIKGSSSQYWISRQPMTSWNQEDCVVILHSCYSTMSQSGISMQAGEEGVSVDTIKKKQIPIMVPIKSSFSIRKGLDKLYLYTDITIMGYVDASVLGGVITGTGGFDYRLIIGRGFLPEEVEELLSPTQ